MRVLASVRSGSLPGLLRVLAVQVLLSVGLFASAAAQGANTAPERTYTCPLGGRTFSGPDIAPIRYSIVQLDLRGPSAIAPLPRCPGNGLVLFKLDFSPAEKAKISRALGDAVFRKDINGHSTHYQAAMILQATGASPDQAARFFLAAVWDAQGVAGAPLPSYAEWRGLYLRRAVDALDAYLAQHGSNDPSAVKLDILAAELQRQRGEFKDALRRLEGLPTLGLLSQRFERRWVRRLRAEIAAGNRRPARLAQGEGIATRVSEAVIGLAGQVHDRTIALWTQDASPAPGVASAVVDGAASGSGGLGPLLRPSLR